MTSEQELNQNARKERLMDVLFRAIPQWKLPRVGDIVEGTIISKEGSAVFVNLGFGTGIIYGKEFQDGRDILKQKDSGDQLVSKIIELENEQGYVELSVREAGREKFWKEASQVMAEKSALVLRALEANRGGLVFEWKTTKGFLPVSQLAQKHYPRVEGGDKARILDELQKFVGQDFSLQIMNIDPKEDKIIFTERGSEPDEMKERLAKYAIGTEYEGEVSGVVEFGIFVKLEDGLEGLVHISEIDWTLVENPGDLYKVGDTVRVKIIEIEGDKISLSVKALKPDPWKIAKIEKGDITKGIVMKFNRYGAFVRLVDHEGISGLSHISEFGTAQKMRETIDIGKTYPFQIVVFQPETHKLSLSFLGNEEKAKQEEVKKTDAVEDKKEE
ncbi:MAG: S1 RNA-binding domain-containing protein [Patescibacteria group bacterium]